MLVNDDLIIDLGPDTQTAMTMYDKDMEKIKHLLQTHIYADHYDEKSRDNRCKYSNIWKPYITRWNGLS